MARLKTQARKYTISLNEAQNEALKRLMQEDMQENVSQFFGMMIAEVVKGREKKTKVGRPVGKDDPKEKQYYPCPYDENAPPYSMDDLEAYYTFRSMPVPAQPAPYTKEQLKKWGME